MGKPYKPFVSRASQEIGEWIVPLLTEGSCPLSHMGAPKGGTLNPKPSTLKVGRGGSAIGFLLCGSAKV